MGHGNYSDSARSVRAKSSGYATKSRDEIFTQQRERRVHAEMDPKDVVYRECRDNDDHPNTVPVQLYLDVTGSMGHIPHMLIKDGLPTLISRLIQNGFPDIALMFGAIGDHECDRHPLQIGQFESGDEELDMWLTRTYIEGGGGANGGESYGLAWYFAANHIDTDASAKRGKKGFVFTIGDEPNLDHYPLSALKQIMGDSCKAQGTMTAAELYAAACQENHVFHIFLTHGYRRLNDSWKQLLGECLLECKDHEAIPQLISDTMIKYADVNVAAQAPIAAQAETATEGSKPSLLL